jgi:hypothetical protein
MQKVAPKNNKVNGSNTIQGIALWKGLCKDKNSCDDDPLKQIGCLQDLYPRPRGRGRGGGPSPKFGTWNKNNEDHIFTVIRIESSELHFIYGTINGYPPPPFPLS